MPEEMTSGLPQVLPEGKLLDHIGDRHSSNAKRFKVVTALSIPDSRFAVPKASGAAVYSYDVIDDCWPESLQTSHSWGGCGFCA